MNKEKEIEEMIKITQRHMETLCETPCDEAVFRDMMRTLTYAGYRKADEVKKETVREILEYLRAVQEKDELKNCDLDWIAMQYGVEVDE